MHTAISLAVEHALLSETRIRILALLRSGPKSVTALTELLGTSMATTSQNLQTLLRGRAVAVEQKSTTREYRLAADLHPVVSATLALLEES